MRFFCTYFDSNYLVKGLALYRSLARHAGEFRLWVLCLDEAAYRALQTLALPGLAPLRLEELECADGALAAAKAGRSRVEYYFTCTSALVCWLLAEQPQVDLLTYLDADLYFYGSPDPIDAELGSGSVLIVPHRFPPALRYLQSRGVYNVGYVSFRRDESGLACAAWWRARCLEWCYDREEPGRFADQKYLDQWPELFSGVVALRHPGAGLAPWNMAAYDYGEAGGQPLVDGQELVFVHFHGLKQTCRYLWDPHLSEYGVPASRVLRRAVYGPYLRELWDVRRWLAGRGLAAPAGTTVRTGPAQALGARPLRYGALSASARSARRRLELARDMLLRRKWLVIGGRLV